MVASYPKAPKRIFIIGPMGKRESDPRGLALSRHIPNIAQATRQVLRLLKDKLGDALPESQVIEPPNIPGSSIPREVFSHIMHCDFAIADLSTGSPNVTYELAMLHANGVPTILIGSDIFYLNQSNALNVPEDVADFNVDTLAKALTGDSLIEGGRPGHLEQLMTVSNNKRFWNPITQHFGGVDMINVAAATGVATGNFHNFTSWVLMDGGVFREKPELVDLVLIRPDRIGDVDGAIGKLQVEFGIEKKDKNGNLILKKDGTPEKEIPSLWVDETRHPRDGYQVKRIGNHLLDYPTPISSLRSSRQYIDFGDYLREAGGGLEDDDFKHFETRLINIYFNTLEGLACSAANNCDWGRVKVLNLKDAIDHLRT